jgi:hypothetical protein
MRLKLGGGLSERINLTEGLLQGDSLSPLLFCLFIADIQERLEKEGFAGIKISDTGRVQLLLYADDTVVLAKTAGEMHKKIRILSEYFDELGLKVNLSKTKIIVFRKGGKLGREACFFFKGEQIECVNTYTYLGVLFSSSGLFSKATKARKSSARAISGKVIQILKRGRSDSLVSANKLFEACVSTSLLYCSAVWGLRHTEEIEGIQTSFYRRLLGLSWKSPGVMIRLETGRVKLIYNILLHSFALIKRVECMDSHRYPYQVLTQLRHLHALDPNSKRNWYSEFTRMVNSLGIQENAEWQNNEIRRGWMRLLWNKDKSTVSESHNLSFYAGYANFCSDLPVCANYLNIGMSWSDKILLAQCRLMSNYVFYGRDVFSFEFSANCSCCNLGQQDHPDEMWHMIKDCRIQCGDLRLYAANNVPNTKFLYKIFDKQNKNDYSWLIRELLSMLRRRNLALDR